MAGSIRVLRTAHQLTTRYRSRSVTWRAILFIWIKLEVTDMDVTTRRAKVWWAPVGVTLLCVALVASAGGVDLRYAAPGEIQMHVSVYPMCGLHAPGEPLIATVQLQNLCDELVFVLDADRLIFELLDDRGECIYDGRPLHKQGRSDQLHSVLRIPAGARSPAMVLSLERPSCLSSPGTRAVHVALPDYRSSVGAGSLAAAPSVLAEASFDCITRPAEPGDVDAIVQHLVWYATWCSIDGTVDESFWPDAWKRPATRSLLRDHAGEMLGVMGEEAALPYLVQVAHTEATQWAFDGIAKIATPAARAALELLAGSARTRVAERAQGALTTLPPLTDEPEE